MKPQTAPLALTVADLPVEQFDDPARGNIRWSTIFSADRTATEAIVCGVAMLEPGDKLALHHHAEPEVYLGVEGEATVLISGKAHRLRPGVALFIPGNAVHGVIAETGAARFFYVFAGDSFADVIYHFAPAAAPPAGTDPAP